MKFSEKIKEMLNDGYILTVEYENGEQIKVAFGFDSHCVIVNWDTEWVESEKDIDFWAEDIASKARIIEIIY